MRQDKAFTISALHAIIPYTSRASREAGKWRHLPSNGRCVIDDGKGNIIPDDPGKV